MTSFLLASIRSIGDGVFGFGFRDPGGRVVEYDFAVRDLPTASGLVMREIVASDTFREAVDAWDGEDTWLGRIAGGFADLAVAGWEPLALTTVDVQRHVLTLRNPEGAEVPVEVTVPYHGADPDPGAVRPAEPFELPERLTESIAALVRFFDMQSVDPLEIEA